MTDSGQVDASAAEVYDELFLPALFAGWPARLLETLELAPGMRVADVACGTGVLTLAAAEAVGPTGAALGIDLNPGMLAVARRKAPAIEWIEAPAEDLPIESASCDAVVSQFGLMFFGDRRAALREMWRVLRPGGDLAVAVWDSLERNPGYAAATRLLDRTFGREVGDQLRAPYALGDADALRSLLVEAGVERPEVARRAGEARFPSIRSWVQADVRGWTLSDQIDDAQLERLVAEAEDELGFLVTSDGSVCFDHPALIATARKP